MLADHGLSVLSQNAGLANGLQVHAGEITHRGLAEDVNRPYRAYGEIAASLRRA